MVYPLTGIYRAIVQSRPNFRYSLRGTSRPIRCYVRGYEWWCKCSSWHTCPERMSHNSLCFIFKPFTYGTISNSPASVPAPLLSVASCWRAFVVRCFMNYQLNCCVYDYYHATACNAMQGYCEGLSVSPSVRLSIERVHCDKTKET